MKLLQSIFLPCLHYITCTSTQALPPATRTYVTRLGSLRETYWQQVLLPTMSQASQASPLVESGPLGASYNIGSLFDIFVGGGITLTSVTKVELDIITNVLNHMLRIHRLCNRIPCVLYITPTHVG